MVLPLLPIAIAGVGGGLAGGLVSSFFGGGGKKDVGVSEVHAPKEHFAPVTTHAPSISRIYSPSVMYQIESPGARMSKKDIMTAKSEADPFIAPMRYDPGAPSAGITEGTDLSKIALIGAVGLIAYGVVSKK